MSEPKSIGTPEEKLLCKRCGGEFVPVQKTQLYCTYNCKAKEKSRRQENRRVKSRKEDRWSDLRQRPKILARCAVYRALRNGTLIKAERCELCGSDGPLEGHHFKGYEIENRLEVMWVCTTCHGIVEEGDDLNE